MLTANPQASIRRGWVHKEKINRPFRPRRSAQVLLDNIICTRKVGHAQPGRCARTEVFRYKAFIFYLWHDLRYSPFFNMSMLSRSRESFWFLVLANRLVFARGLRVQLIQDPEYDPEDYKRNAGDRQACQK